MGGCGSKSTGVGKNSVDAQLQRDAVTDKLHLKILLLGSGESGKSTVLKQIKTVHKISMTPEELEDVKNSLKRNAHQCMVVLIEQAEKFEYKFDADESRARTLTSFEWEEDVEFSVELADHIVHLWRNSEAIKKTYERRSEYWLLDATEYYFTHLERFMQDDFEPTEEDCVMARVMTTGIISTDIPIQPLKVTLVDVGGQRTERRKWIHCFDNVNAIIYVVNLAGYNSVLFEDQSMNRMEECFNLFKQTAMNPAFATTPIFVFFNKKDLFETKIKKEPITACKVFADYQGNGELMECISFIEEKFKNAVTTGKERITVYPIAARFKKDVGAVWSEVLESLKATNKRSIDRAMKQLSADDGV